MENQDYTKLKNEINQEIEFMKEFLKNSKEQGYDIPNYESWFKVLNKLCETINCNDCKILIAGHTNAGKSSLVNALLEMDIVKENEFSCKTGFCEIVNSIYNNNIEEVHAYKKVDDENYEIITIDDYKNIVKNSEESLESDIPYEYFKIYCNMNENSLLNNNEIQGILIDSPGFNSDDRKNFNVYDKEKDIDLVIFVTNPNDILTKDVSIFYIIYKFI